MILGGRNSQRRCHLHTQRTESNQTERCLSGMRVRDVVRLQLHRTNGGSIVAIPKHCAFARDLCTIAVYGEQVWHDICSVRLYCKWYVRSIDLLQPPHRLRPNAVHFCRMSWPADTESTEDRLLTDRQTDRQTDRRLTDGRDRRDMHNTVLVVVRSFNRALLPADRSVALRYPDSGTLLHFPGKFLPPIVLADINVKYRKDVHLIIFRSLYEKHNCISPNYAPAAQQTFFDSVCCCEQLSCSVSR